MVISPTVELADLKQTALQKATKLYEKRGNRGKEYQEVQTILKLLQ